MHSEKNSRTIRIVHFIYEALIVASKLLVGLALLAAIGALVIAPVWLTWRARARVERARAERARKEAQHRWLDEVSGSELRH